MSKIDVGDTVIIIRSSIKQYVSQIGVVHNRMCGAYGDVLRIRFCKNSGCNIRRISEFRVMKIE